MRSLAAGRGAFARVARFVPAPLWLAVAVIGGIAAVFPYAFVIQPVDIWEVGTVATETVIAPFTFDISKSPDEIEREKQEARDKVLLVVDFDDDARRRSVGRLRTYARSLQLLGPAPHAPSDTFRATLASQLGKELSSSTIAAIRGQPGYVSDAVRMAERALNKGVIDVLLVASEGRLEELRDRFRGDIGKHRAYRKQFVILRRDSSEMTIPSGDLLVEESVLESIARQLRTDRKYEEPVVNALYELLSLCIEPDAKVNEEATARREASAVSALLSYKGKVIKDSEIVRAHQEITPQIAEKLRALQSALASTFGTDERWRVVSGNVGRLATALLPLVFVVFYLKRYHPRVLRDTRHMAALVSVVVLQAALIRLSVALAPRMLGSAGEWGQFAPEYVTPVAAAAVLAGILFGPELGYLAALYTAAYFGVALGFKMQMALFAMLGGLAAAFAVRHVRYRWDFFKAIPAAVAAYALVVILWDVSLGRPLSAGVMAANLGMAAGGALLSMVVAMVVTPLFEKAFNITTDITLVELSDMSSPVLKRLSIEAPGTYNHSVLVANLAESAAEKIGANALRARVGSYYHDIGKLEKSDYFIENVRGTDRNRHNKLSPSMSALIISSHVKEGVDLASQNRLPQVIQDAILQHHGTSTVSFFYEKALEQDPHKQVQEDDFRYPGPRPSTRENAVIMLADAVEAASRSLATSSPRLLRELVKKIIRDKFLAGQLDQCDLTLKDLDDIVEGFMPVLQGIFHTRIEYPST